MRRPKKNHLYKPNSSENMSPSEAKPIKILQILVMVEDKS